jgi:peptide/nickel transport system substrate-binding protein
MKKNARLGAATVAAALFAGPVLADDLVIGVATAPTSLDPLYQALGSNHELALHAFNSLFEVSPKMEVGPGLAESWKTTDDPLVWEVKLKKGVKFHNGEPFTAEDVVFTYQRVPNVPNAPSTYKRRTNKVAKAVAVDDHTVLIHTKTPFPLLPRALMAVPIVSRKIGIDAKPTEFNDGSKTYGTGPYKFVEFVPGDRTTYVANQDYWGPKPKWDKVTIREIKSDPARVAALLSGDVDVIATVPTTDVDKLDKDPNVNVSCTASGRVIYWSLDVFRENADYITAKDGSPIKNPLRDLRVRQAFNMAIDRNSIVDDVMRGLAVPANQIVNEDFGGYNPDIPMPEPDLEKAKQLLKEAGYGDGFKLTIHATNNRYVNDAKLAQGVAQMLSRIGIDVTVETMPVAVYYGKARKHEFTMAQIGWSTSTGEASAILAPALGDGQRNNYGRWANAKFNELLDGALSTVDLAEYDRLLKEATAVAIADVPIIPTHYQVVCWAARKGLKVVPRADEYSLAESVEKQ